MAVRHVKHTAEFACVPVLIADLRGIPKYSPEVLGLVV